MADTDSILSKIFRILGGDSRSEFSPGIEFSLGEGMPSASVDRGGLSFDGGSMPGISNTPSTPGGMTTPMDQSFTMFGPANAPRREPIGSPFMPERRGIGPGETIVTPSGGTRNTTQPGNPRPETVNDIITQMREDGRGPPGGFNMTGGSALRDRFVTETGDLLSRIRAGDPFSEGLLNDFIGNTRGSLDRFRDNREGFIASQINPLIRQLQGVPRRTERDFARRGIAGSLPASIVSQQEQDIGRAISEARSQAEAQALGLEQDITNNFLRARESAVRERAANLGLEGQALDNYMRASQSALNAELKRLGLEMTERIADEDFDIGGTLGGIGALLAGIGDLGDDEDD